MRPTTAATEHESALSHGNSASLTEIAAAAPGRYRVIRRNGKVTSFDKNKIRVAVTKAFLAVEGSKAAASGRIREAVDQIVEQVTHALTRNKRDGGIFHIEDIQDQVELALMRGDHYKVARAYVLYREEHAKARAAQQSTQNKTDAQPILNVALSDGSLKPLDIERLRRVVIEACCGTTDVENCLAHTLMRLNRSRHWRSNTIVRKAQFRRSRKSWVSCHLPLTHGGLLDRA
jgi:ribonucleoside-diphosphate reductase alpha chain